MPRVVRGRSDIRQNSAQAIDGMRARKSGSQVTPRWRRQSRANPSLKSANSLLAGTLQGISSIRGSAARKWQQKRAINQSVMSQFPTHPNREFFTALQGIKIGDQGNCRPHQGIPSRPPFGPPNPILREISKVAEKGKEGRRQIARVAEGPGRELARRARAATLAIRCFAPGRRGSSFAGPNPGCAS